MQTPILVNLREISRLAYVLFPLVEDALVDVKLLVALVEVDLLEDVLVEDALAVLSLGRRGDTRGIPMVKLPLSLFHPLNAASTAALTGTPQASVLPKDAAVTIVARWGISW